MSGGGWRRVAVGGGERRWEAVRGGENHNYNRVTKDTVIFSAQSFHYLTEKLQLDLHEPPMSQVNPHILNDVQRGM